MNPCLPLAWSVANPPYAPKGKQGHRGHLCDAGLQCRFGERAARRIYPAKEEKGILFPNVER